MEIASWFLWKKHILFVKIKSWPNRHALCGHLLVVVPIIFKNNRKFEWCCYAKIASTAYLGASSKCFTHSPMNAWQSKMYHCDFQNKVGGKIQVYVLLGFFTKNKKSNNYVPECRLRTLFTYMSYFCVFRGNRCGLKWFQLGKKSLQQRLLPSLKLFQLATFSLCGLL